MEFPKVSRVAALTIAIVVLGLAGVIVATWQELIAWSQLMRRAVGNDATTPTTVPTLVVLAGYLQTHLGHR
jgi:hypothetical protein